MMTTITPIKIAFAIGLLGLTMWGCSACATEPEPTEEPEYSFGAEDLAIPENFEKCMGLYETEPGDMTYDEQIFFVNQCAPDVSDYTTGLSYPAAFPSEHKVSYPGMLPLRQRGNEYSHC